MDAKEAKIYLAILIAVAVLGIILVYFIITIIRHQKKNLALHREMIQVEINTLEKERKRIASDLHDELGPLLSSVRLQISCLNTQDKEDTEIIERSNTHIDTIHQRLREISNDLMPHVLLRKGLVSAIKEFAGNINAIQPLQVSFEARNIVIFSKETEIHLYRIIQEIVHNAIKHARANRLELELVLSGKKLVLQASDDGSGFDQETIRRTSSGFGLSNIASRVEILHGDIYIDSKPGKGTQYTIAIELE